MAHSRRSHRPKVPVKVKQALCREAGYKCANPGCPSTLLDLHHIISWHVYQTHDQAEMVVLCPTCHQHSHRGNLLVDCGTVRRWKAISRAPSTRGHIYVEPGERCRVLLGSIYVANGQPVGLGMTVFDLSGMNRLSFRMMGADVMLLNAAVSDIHGNELLHVDEGHLWHCAVAPVRYESRVGRHRLTVPAAPEYVPQWVWERYDETADAPLAVDGRVTIFDVEVLDRGVVQVRGVWAKDRHAVVISDHLLSVCTEQRRGFVHLQGYGNVRGDRDLSNLPVWQYDGPIDVSFLAALLKCSQL